MYYTLLRQIDIQTLFSSFLQIIHALLFFKTMTLIHCKVYLRMNIILFKFVQHYRLLLMNFLLIDTDLHSDCVTFTFTMHSPLLAIMISVCFNLSFVLSVYLHHFQRGLDYLTFCLRVIGCTVKQFKPISLSKFQCIYLFCNSNTRVL